MENVFRALIALLCISAASCQKIQDNKAEEDGMRVPIISQEFTFERNHNTHIKFSLSNSSKTNTFGIVAEEAWEDGEIIEVEQDGIDTEIKP